jgi:hypothetical protein
MGAGHREFAALTERKRCKRTVGQMERLEPIGALERFMYYALKQELSPGRSGVLLMASSGTLHALERVGFATRLFQGEGPVWTDAPIFVCEGEDGRREYFTLRPEVL